MLEPITGALEWVDADFGVFWIGRLLESEQTLHWKVRLAVQILTLF